MLAVTSPYVYPKALWTPLTANKPYSLLTDGVRQFVFETRDYDHWAEPVGYSDGPNMIRSEVYGPPFPPHVLTQFMYTLTVDPGPVTTNCWCIFGQIHAENSIGASPPVSLNLQPDGHGGEKLVVNRNYDDGHGIVYQNLESIPFKRGIAMRIRLVFVDSWGQKNGRIQFFADSHLVTDFKGPTGYYTAKGPSYPKYGIYAGGKGGDSQAIPDRQIIRATYDNPIFMVAG